MPVIVDASIRGKVKFPTFPNVVTDDQPVQHVKQPAGIIRTTTDNANKVAAASGKIQKIVASSTTKEGSEAVRKSSTQAITNLKDTGKGIYISKSA